MQSFQGFRSNGLSCTVDWLSFTDVINSDVLLSISEFGFSRDEFVESDKGAFGYKKMLLHQGSTIRVLYDGHEGMGIHYDCSGSSIRVLYDHFVEFRSSGNVFDSGQGYDYGEYAFDTSILAHLMDLIKHVGHVTRLDLAIDDCPAEYYSVREVYLKVQAQLFVSKFRSWRYVKDAKDTGEVTGETIYLGSRCSDIMLRVYDKQLERIAKGVEGAEDLPWVRWEFELKNEYANVALIDIINGVDVGSLVFGILSNYFRIVKLDDSNKSRCSSEKKWQRFIGEVQKLQLFVKHELPTLKDKEDWVLRQVAPTITGLLIANYGDISFLFDHQEQHIKRMNKHLRKLISQVRPGWEKELEV